jgi:hypothetical protein
MMQRRTFINKASFGFLLFGHPGFISAITSDSSGSHLLAEDLISMGHFKYVSIFEFDPKIERLISREANSLIKTGYVSDQAGYLISSSRKKVLSFFSVQSGDKNKGIQVALVLEKANKGWKLVHSLDSFEIEARTKALTELSNHPKISIMLKIY